MTPKQRRQLKEMVAARLAPEKVTVSEAGEVFIEKTVDRDRPIGAVRKDVTDAFPGAVVESTEKSIGASELGKVRIRFWLRQLPNA